MLLINNSSGYAGVFLIEINANLQYTMAKISGNSNIELKLSLENGVLTISEHEWLAVTLISTSPISIIK